MGLNFKDITHGKVGDIIYPAYNATNGYWKTDRWDLVVEVNSDGKIIARKYIWDYATVRAIELIQELKKLDDKTPKQKEGARKIKKDARKKTRKTKKSC